MADRYSIIRNGPPVPPSYRNRLWFKDVQYIEDTLRGMKEHRNYCRCYMQVKAMLVDLDCCITDLAGYPTKDTYPRVDKKLRALKEAVDELKIKMETIPR